MTALRRADLWALAALAAAACFDPDYPELLPCGVDGFCPPGQTCGANNLCRLSEVDAGGDGDGGPAADAGLGELRALDIGPDVTIAVGQTHTFTPTAVYDNGAELVDPLQVVWSSSDTAVAFVDFMGVAHGESAGTAEARGMWEGRVGTASVTVTP